jgi:hypothetical protein
MPEVPVTVRLDADGVPPVEAPGRFDAFTLPQRIKRSGLLMVVALGIAVPFVFIPIIHFLAVPMILIFGSIMAVKQLRSVGRLAPLRIACPKCAALNRVGGGVGYRSFGPIERPCDSCRRRLSLTVVPIPGSQVPPPSAQSS